MIKKKLTVEEQKEIGPEIQSIKKEIEMFQSKLSKDNSEYMFFEGLRQRMLKAEACFNKLKTI